MKRIFDDAMRELQTPEHAERIAIMVTESLDTVRGFSVLPRDLQLEISKAASALYGAGYVKGCERSEYYVARKAAEKLAACLNNPDGPQAA